MVYRPDLDFLRAIAVLGVVLFHIGVPQFRSGFIGVDVFLVLSGYLIGTIICQEVVQGRFSVRDFLERRARRILPALFILILLNFPMILYVFAPSDIEFALKSVLSIVSFTSNIYYWRQSGYFDPKSEFQPFLHTWSVAVEIQFYIMMCLLTALFLRRKSKHDIARYVATLFVFSFTFSIFCSIWKPGVAFYLLPSRLWEFLLGTLLALFELSSRGNRSTNIHSALLKSTGFLLIVFSLTKEALAEPWPNFSTLIPAIGACMFIHFPVTGKITRSIFNLKMLVLVGRVSYGWFLWHWPLIVYFNYFTDLQVSTISLALVSIGTLLLSVVQWRFVEIPLRNRTKIPTNRFYRVILSQFLSIVIFATAGIFLHGYQKVWEEVRISKEHKFVAGKYLARERELEIKVEDLGCIFTYNESNENQEEILDYCRDKYGKEVHVIGDSHGLVLFDIIAKSGLGEFVINWSRPTSRPQAGISGQYKDFLKFSKDNSEHVSRVVFMQSGSYLLEDQFGKVDSAETFRHKSNFRTSKVNVDLTLDYLEEISKYVSVIWIGPYVESRINPNNPQNWNDTKEISRNVVNVFSKLDLELAFFAKQRNVEYVSSQRHFKFKHNRILVGDCIVWRDQDHWSECGRQRLALSSREFLDAQLFSN